MTDNARVEYLRKIYKNIKQFEPMFNALTTIKWENDINQVIEESQMLKNRPLKGMPVIVKDTIYTRDLPTTAGAVEYRKFQPDHDATVVFNIRKNGGLIIAKSNTPEFAEDYQTFNDVFGVTNNPYNPDLTAGGSSGGSAASIALGYTDMAIGSDFGGSLRVPASFCGIYSLRPTINRVEVDGHLPALEPGIIGTIGPMASSLPVLSRLFAAMTGQSLNSPESKSLGELRILLSSSLDEIPIQPQITDAILQWSNQLQDKLVLDQFNSYPGFENLHEPYIGIYRLLYGKPVSKSLSYYKEKQQTAQQQIDNLMKDYDALILPVTSIQPYPHSFDHSDFMIAGESVNYWVANGYYSRIASVTGNPVITLPIGRIANIPVGIQLIGHRGKDESLLEIASTLEASTKRVMLN